MNTTKKIVTMTMTDVEIYLERGAHPQDELCCAVSWAARYTFHKIDHSHRFNTGNTVYSLPKFDIFDKEIHPQFEESLISHGELGQEYFDRKKKRYTHKYFSNIIVVYEPDVAELSTRLSILRGWVGGIDLEDIQILREQVLYSPEMEQWLEVFWPHTISPRHVPAESALATLTSRVLFNYTNGPVGLDGDTLSALCSKLREEVKAKK